MKARWLSLLLGAVVVAGCNDSAPKSTALPPKKEGPVADPYAACTDPELCCPFEELVCEGDGPDGNTVCTCEKLWDCNVDPNKCSQDAPVPPGGSAWDCWWSEFVYRCESAGEEDSPPGGAGWNCTWQAAEHKWVCQKDSPPNPSNKPDGAHQWNCVYNEEAKKLICERGSPPASQPPAGGQQWDCNDEQSECDRKDSDGGLPSGTGTWKCNRVVRNSVFVWVCYGEVPHGSPPPGGSAWDCEQLESEDAKDSYKCVQSDQENPPGGGQWVCAKGSEFAGTHCVKASTPPAPPPLYPKAGDVCTPGVNYWCDGVLYCGWGQVTCKSDGTWPTRADGKIDCVERQDGRRPNTVCACYHFYFNAACCERPDCAVTPGSDGQICPESDGKLCAYCNPQNPSCSEQGAYCVVTSSMETFCGKACANDAQCPTDYKCVEIKGKANKQCIPSDFSCFY